MASYILKFFVRKIQKLATATRSISGSGRGRQGSHDSDPLLSEEGGGYQAVEDPHSQRSLTAAYVSYDHSAWALRSSLFNLAIYFALAVVAFSFVFEKWPITDSVYFAAVVFTTVGYGDLSPQTDAGRLVTIFIALYGIIILGGFLSIVGEKIIEAHDENLKRRLANARKRILGQFSEEDTAVEQTRENVFLEDVRDITIAEFPIIVIMSLLMIPIGWVEGWSPIQCVYWMVITGTTVGFGDLGPTTVGTKIACVFYVPLAVAVLGEFVGRIAAAYMERKQGKVESQFMARSMTLSDLEVIDTDKDKRVSEKEFLCFILVALQKVEKEEIDEIMTLFRKLDRSNTGTIDKEDLIEIKAREQL